MFTNNNLTPEQRAAINRANAQHSTGAKTEAGHNASSQNRTTHGLARHNGPFAFLEWEDPSAFEDLKAGFVAEYQPATTTECYLLNTMAESVWLAQRAQYLGQTVSCDAARGLIEQPMTFNLYLRYETTYTRAFHKALNDLLKLRAAQRKEAAQRAGFEAQKQKEAEKALKNQLDAINKQLKTEEELMKTPEFRDLANRLGMALQANSPEVEALKKEFERKFGAVMFGRKNSQAQAA